MARNIKPYNYSYRVAKQFLKENPKAEFTYTIIYTIAHLPKKYNYSKEGVKRAWDDHQKSSVENPFGPPIYKITKWPKGVYDAVWEAKGKSHTMMILDDAVDSINWTTNIRWTIK